MSKSKTPKKFHFDSWFMNKLRQICRTFPPYYTVRNRNKEYYYVPTKAGGQMKRVKNTCEICNRSMKNDEVRVDHKDPVIPLTGRPLRPDGRTDWNIVIDRLLEIGGQENNLQKICQQCHLLKSKEENKQRKLLTKKKD